MDQTLQFVLVMLVGMLIGRGLVDVILMICGKPRIPFDYLLVPLIRRLYGRDVLR